MFAAQTAPPHCPSHRQFPPSRSQRAAGTGASWPAKCPIAGADTSAPCHPTPPQFPAPLKSARYGCTPGAPTTQPSQFGQFGGNVFPIAQTSKQRTHYDVTVKIRPPLVPIRKVQPCQAIRSFELFHTVFKQARFIFYHSDLVMPELSRSIFRRRTNNKLGRLKCNARAAFRLVPVSGCHIISFHRLLPLSFFSQMD